MVGEGYAETIAEFEERGESDEKAEEGYAETVAEFEERRIPVVAAHGH